MPPILRPRWSSASSKPSRSSLPIEAFGPLNVLTKPIFTLDACANTGVDPINAARTTAAGICFILGLPLNLSVAQVFASIVPNYRQRQRSHERDVWRKLQRCVRCQPKVWKPGGKFLQRDLGLQPREGSAEAEMHAMAEGEMVFCVGAADVKTVGIRKYFRIAIGGAEQQQQLGIGRDRN